MREFKEPNYTGPECVCCKSDLDAVRQQERKRLVAKFEEADSACSPWAIAIIEGDLQSNAIFSEEKLQSTAIDGETNE